MRAVSVFRVRAYQAGVPQHAQVAADRGPADREPVGDLAGREWLVAQHQQDFPPHRLALSAADEHGGWHMDMVLAETAGVTELRFTHHLTGTYSVGEVGPGWEYYLDALVASRDGEPAPDFNDYYPAMKEHFQAQR